MERMWRKVNQGLTGRTKTQHSTDTLGSAGFGEQQNVVAVSGTTNSNNTTIVSHLPSSTATGRRLASSGMPIPMSTSISQHVLKTQSTASSERRRRRRRKSRARRDFVIYEQAGAAASAHQDTTLKQKAVAKFRLFNFHLNWDLHMTQCKPCGYVDFLF